MIGPALSDSLRAVATRLVRAGITDSSDVEVVAETILYTFAEEICTCADRLHVAIDPDEHDEECAYLALVEALETAAVERAGAGS